MIETTEPYLIARTYRELQRRRLPVDAASLNRLTFTRDGRRSEPPTALRAAISEMTRRYG